MSTERTILLAVSTTRYSQHLVASAMSEARRLRESGDTVRIDVLYVIEDEELRRVSSTVGDEGFLGLSPQQDIFDALAAEHDRTAMKRVDEVQEAAAEGGFPVEVHKESGRFDATVLQHAEQHKADVIFLTRADRPFISRFLFGSEADRVARLARSQGLAKVVIDQE